MNAKSLVLICPLLLTLACNDKKKFGAEVDSTETPAESASEDAKSTTSTDTIAPTTSSDSTTPETTEVPDCAVGESQVTKVKLLTTGVNLAIENQIIKYELSVLSCSDGSIVPINDQTIHFDLDLVYSGDLPSIGYSVVDSATSSKIVSGDLQTVKGSDLFGNTGSGYRHWVTDNVSFTSKVEKVILEINLKKAKLNTYKASDTTADSYLKMGTASAVTQTLTIIDQP